MIVFSSLVQVRGAFSLDRAAPLFLQPLQIGLRHFLHKLGRAALSSFEKSFLVNFYRIST
jgi:hypothetical protein